MDRAKHRIIMHIWLVLRTETERSIDFYVACVVGTRGLRTSETSVFVAYVVGTRELKPNEASIFVAIGME